MRVVRSRIEYWSTDYDRQVLIIKEGVEIIGIDFFQGDEQYDFTGWMGNDAILAVYHASLPYLSGDDDLECVNQAINIWFELSNEGLYLR